MLVTPFPIVMLAKFVQSSNTELPMLVTLSGIVTLIKLSKFENAESAIILVPSLIV